MEFKIATRQSQDQNGVLHMFHYYLTIDQIHAGAFFCENYGVRISDENGESAAIPSITVSALRMDELMTLLVDNRVSPSGLTDVVMDWI